MDKIKEDIIRYRFDDPKKAFDLCRQLYQGTYSTMDQYGMSYALLYMGDTSLTLGETEQAFRYLEQAAAIQISYGYDDLLMTTYNVQGVTYSTINDSSNEMECYFRSLEVARRQKNYIMQAMLYCNISALYLDMDAPEEALKFLDEGYETGKKQTEKTSIILPEAERHINRASIYRQMKEYQKAYEEVKLADKEAFKPNIVLALSEKIYILLGMERRQEARSCMEELINVPEQEYQRTEFIREFSGVVEVMVENGFVTEAKKITVRCIQFMEERGSIHVRKLLCRMQIQIAEAEGDRSRLLGLYRNYRSLSQQQKTEDEKSIVLALDKRIRVERERYRNQKLEQANEELRRRSYVDALTGIENRRGMWNYVNENFPKMQEKQEKFGLMILDVDHFKQLNDTLGHLEGDRCLTSIARTILQQKDTDSYAVRYGGDEFMLLTQNASDEALMKQAEKIMQEIRNLQITFPYQEHAEQITVSIGIINEVPLPGMEFIDYISKADQKLYDAKKSGRDIIIFA